MMEEVEELLNYEERAEKGRKREIKLNEDFQLFLPLCAGFLGRISHLDFSSTLEKISFILETFFTPHSISVSGYTLLHVNLNKILFFAVSRDPIKHPISPWKDEIQSKKQLNFFSALFSYRSTFGSRLW